MDSQSLPPAPCYECGKLTHKRLVRVWVIDAHYRDDDGQVLLPGTPVCDDSSAADYDDSCLSDLYSDTSSIDSLADKIAHRYSRADWTPLGGNGVTRPEPAGGF